jgi:hypothetical protein
VQSPARSRPLHWPLKYTQTLNQTQRSRSRSRYLTTRESEFEYSSMTTLESTTHSVIGLMAQIGLRDEKSTPSCALVPGIKLSSGNSIRKCESLNLIQEWVQTQNITTVLVSPTRPFRFDNPDSSKLFLDCEEFLSFLCVAIKSDVRLVIASSFDLISTSPGPGGESRIHY